MSSLQSPNIGQMHLYFSIYMYLNFVVLSSQRSNNHENNAAGTTSFLLVAFGCSNRTVHVEVHLGQPREAHMSHCLVAGLNDFIQDKHPDASNIPSRFSIIMCAEKKTPNDAIQDKPLALTFRLPPFPCPRQLVDLRASARTSRCLSHLALIANLGKYVLHT